MHDVVTLGVGPNYRTIVQPIHTALLEMRLFNAMHLINRDTYELNIRTIAK